MSDLSTRQSARGTAAPARPRGRRLRRLLITLGVLLLLAVAAVLGISGYVASRLVSLPVEAVQGLPSDYGLSYESVRFPSREDNVDLAAWYIRPQIQDRRCTIIMVHGKDHNRNDRSIQMLELARDLSSHGYSVLMLDMRAHGESAGKLFSLGYFERRDVLGAVDYLRSRKDFTGCAAGLGFSTGAVALINAAAQEPAVKAVVADGAWPDTRSLLERELPSQSKLPGFFTPPTLFMARVMYGIDMASVRPIDTIGSIAPRPILLIHGTKDRYTSVAEARALYAAARNPNAQLWVVEGAPHVQSYALHPEEYRERLLTFLDAALAGR